MLALLCPGWTALAAVEPVVLVLGDSLSAEYGLARGSGWVNLLAERLKSAAPALRVVNASVSGDTTAGGASRLPALLRVHRPSVVVLELGGNDALRGLPLDTTQANLARMAQAARSQGARVLLLGQQVPPNYGADYARRFHDLYADLAKRERLALVPFFLAGLADAAQADRWFQADRIHPNEDAQPVMLNNVWPHLEPLLK